MSSSRSLRPLRRDELPAAYRALAASFDEDPLFRFLLPERDERRAWLQLIMAVALATADPDGEVLTPGSAPASAVIALIPPNRYPPPSTRLLAPFVGKTPRPPVPLPRLRLIRSGIGVLRAVSEAHLEEPHYYVLVVGVHPARKGRGLGHQMMVETCQLADEARVPVYLETSNPVNLGFYRRYGFEIERELVTPGGGPPVWTMMRSRAGQV